MTGALGPTLCIEPMGEDHNSGTDDEGYMLWQQVVWWWWLNWSSWLVGLDLWGNQGWWRWEYRACPWTRCAGILVFPSHGVYCMVVIKWSIQYCCYHTCVVTASILGLWPIFMALSFFAWMVWAFIYGSYSCAKEAADSQNQISQQLVPMQTVMA